ncbi:hypothetical protein ONZ43_g5714 [Nemania bipapillata]|uniref:Uncharacterized protein n=1 Tax=Nemania bipapillata TaxID=110536 RepID=A0ACC2I7F4_9PEZI|nr:hypothetical protein ONZ43_g5714 [Nemania bipapillata]
MLLLHQVGSVKIGEVVRYTVTYTPSRDRILPSPETLHLRIRNTSPLPLRAAFVHGPYTLSVSAYPSHYDPNTKFDNPRRYGVPEFEPMLKAAGSWSCHLVVPDNIRQSAGMGAARGDFANGGVDGSEDISASWIVEISSQVIFSSSASVGFELLLARDEKSLSLVSTPVNKGQAHVQLPGKVSDFQQSIIAGDSSHPGPLKGVFSRAMGLKVEDTASLWNTPKIPGWNDWDHGRAKALLGHGNAAGSSACPAGQEEEPKNNLGADMLYLKESIDATARQAKVDAKIRKAREKAARNASQNKEQTEIPVEADGDESDNSDEEVVVRGFSGNATRTERGLTWRAPTIARSGWGAIVGTLGESAHKKVMGESQPESKPLLRILPTGPAHVALKKFRNRTVYSNVVNDGIVPLRTSCLLFLDWQGLDRVEKARREAGLVETVVGFGWAELTGTGMSSRKGPWNPDAEDASSPPTPNSVPEGVHGNSHEVPQPSNNATVDDDRQSLNLVVPPRLNELDHAQSAHMTNDSPFSGFFNLFKGHSHSKTQVSNSPPSRSPGEDKIYKRSQTLKFDDTASNSTSSSRTKVSSGRELEDDQGDRMSAPPRTTFFESAGDLLNPKLPPVDFLLDPSKRPRTIFHDRIYHPSDIPPPPLKKRPTGSLMIRRRTTGRTGSQSPKRGSSLESSPAEAQNAGVKHQDSILSARDYDDRLHTDPGRQPDEVIDSSNMRVEEKIARAYHRDLSWRKVLVNLEPDAHNNIIVRRMFANAFGWPVVKHLVDAHFSDDATARTRDDLENNAERAKAMDKGPDVTGAETKRSYGQGGTNTCDDASDQPQDAGKQSAGHKDHVAQSDKRSASEVREAADTVPDLPTPQDSKSQASHSFRESPSRSPFETTDPAAWSDRDFADSEDESEFDMDSVHGRHVNHKPESSQGEGSGEKERGSLSPVWNWTEKIVGKGATRKPKGSGPQSPTDARGSGSSGAIANA